ncbi:LapA family protein [Arthrobacter sp. Leaf337]|uniref:LapA family protein n=1 Tax=Arthrobacter sp. Leaf337 TaxID=1736342 RepID=UPI0009E68684|nr:lipopolysaccharide assembly protein LapA domain-containing protein [Arthrobacter sp. Leaf337]
MTQQSPDYEPNEANAVPPTPAARPTQGTPAQGVQVPDAPGQAPGPRATPTAPIPPEDRHVTRAGMVWAAVATALAVMVLLIIFILQNQDYVQVRYFGLEGAVPLGIALFIAAVGGGVLVAVAGAARIIQLRAAAHRRRVLSQRVR